MGLAADICARYDNQPAALLEILHDLQDLHGYVDITEHLPELARCLGRSRAEIHGVLTFYADFRTAPPARHCLRVCRGEACQSVGGAALMERARELLPADVQVDEVFCLGNCALGPAAQADGELLARVDDAHLRRLAGDWR